jgi:hypothetical protein
MTIGDRVLFLRGDIAGGFDCRAAVVTSVIGAVLDLTVEDAGGDFAAAGVPSILDVDPVDGDVWAVGSGPPEPGEWPASVVALAELCDVNSLP